MTEQSWVKRVVDRVRQLRSRETPVESILCEDVRGNASDYLDGDISETLAGRIRAHLGLCEGCQGWLSGLWSTIALLQALPMAEPPESLRASIRRLK